ncbi:MAG: aminotransferase class III-fold pyridoxal phosphate-dependent enzyme [Merdibacter sp.]
MQHSFHGRTMTTLAATGQESSTKFYPVTGRLCLCASPATIDQGKAAIEKTARSSWRLSRAKAACCRWTAVMCRVPALCQKHDMLLVIDEVQTGIGRTGTLFCYEQYAVQPDIVTAGQRPGRRVPIGAILYGEKKVDTCSRRPWHDLRRQPCLPAPRRSVLFDRRSDGVPGSGQREGRSHPRTAVASISAIRNRVRGLGLMLGIGVDEGKTRPAMSSNAGEGRHRADGRNRYDPSASAAGHYERRDRSGACLHERGVEMKHLLKMLDLSKEEIIASSIWPIS